MYLITIHFYLITIYLSHYHISVSLPSIYLVTKYVYLIAIYVVNTCT